MEQKLIFLDIDGTLTLPGSFTPPDSALAAIRAAQRKGHKVFLCTGRNYTMLSPLLKYGFDGVIGSAGGYIRYGEQVVYDHPMTEDQRDRIVRLLRGSGVLCVLEAKDAVFGDDLLSGFLAEQGMDNSEILRWKATRTGELRGRSWEEYDGRPVYKACFRCQSESQLTEARKALEGEFSFCIQSEPGASQVNGELINRAFNKGTGILRICQHLGVDIRDTYGFGDSMNDLEMIQMAGVGVCMENGNARLKTFADYICPPVEQDGLAKAFDHLGLA